MKNLPLVAEQRLSRVLIEKIILEDTDIKY